MFLGNGQLSASRMGKRCAVIIIGSLTPGDIMMWSTRESVGHSERADFYLYAITKSVTRKKKNARHNQQVNRVVHELQQTTCPLFVDLSAVLESDPFSPPGKLGGSRAAVSAPSCPQLVCKGKQ